MLEKLLAAIERLTAALEAQASGTTAKKTRAQAAVEGAQANIAAGAAQAAAPVATSAASPAAAAPAAGGPTLQDVAAVIKELAKVSRDQAVGLLAKHGAPKASELKPETFAAVIAEGRALLNPPPAAGSDLV